MTTLSNLSSPAASIKNFSVWLPRKHDAPIQLASGKHSQKPKNIGILKLAMQAHKVSSNFLNQSFLEELTIASSICFNFLLEISTNPLVWGW